MVDAMIVWPNSARPFGRRSCSWKPPTPPSENRATPETLTISCRLPAPIGTEIVTSMAGASTSRRPFGWRVKRRMPSRTKIPLPPSMCRRLAGSALPKGSTPTSKVSTRVPLAKETTIWPSSPASAGLGLPGSSTPSPSPGSSAVPSPSSSVALAIAGSSTISVNAWPVWLIRTRSVPVTSSPGIPSSSARP